MARDTASCRTPTPLLLILSVLFSVAIVACNARVLAHAPCVWSLAACHYTFTTVVLIAARTAGWIGRPGNAGAGGADGECARPGKAGLGGADGDGAESFCRPLPVRTAFVMAGLSSLANVAQNLSLRFNHVATYQLFKLAVIPVQVSVYFFLYGKTFSRQTLASLCVLLIGVGLATEAGLRHNGAGLACGVFACCVVPIDTIWNGEKKAEFKLSSAQFNLATGWPRALIATAMALAFEWWPMAFFFHHGKPHELHEVKQYLILSCLAAVGVNLCSVAIIGRLNAVAFQVLGQVKTVLVLAMGGLEFLMSSPMVLPGVGLALGGSFWYAQLRRREGQKAKKLL